MKKEEMNSLSMNEINDKLSELRAELIKQNAQIATGTTPKSPGLIRNMKKNVARLLTIKKRRRD